MSLLGKKENYNFLRREDRAEQEAVIIANPKTVEFELVRTTLIPGLLKTY
jgi:phenylalanyl-tRNA synthetase beta chain